MTKQQIERVIELMNRVTLDLNEVNVLTNGSEYVEEGLSLWQMAYKYKKKFMAMLGESMEDKSILDLLQDEFNKSGHGNTTEVQFCYKEIEIAVQKYLEQKKKQPCAACGCGIDVHRDDMTCPSFFAGQFYGWLETKFIVN